MARKRIVPAVFMVLVALLAGCQQDDEIKAIRADLQRQQAEIDRLSEYVDAQAVVFTACERSVSEMIEFVIDKSTLGMLRSAHDQWDQISGCRDALSEYGQHARIDESESPLNGGAP